MAELSSGKTIAKNTVFLYFRMLFTMVVSLYTSRVNLSVLGIEDNGIYQVVGGVIVMFGFLNASLSGATSRFLTYELGKGNAQRLKSTFSALLNFHILTAIIIFILGETLGLWFLETKLVIPENRMMAARIVYQFTIIQSMINITQIPYNASIISHERMNIFAYFSFLDVTLKLIICYLLYITPYDRLITYGLLSLLVIVFMQMVYRFYCIKHFEECHFQIKTDYEILKPIISFSGWDLFGNLSVMARNQGVSMIMNMFFGPVINAAVGFSNTIGTQVLGFSNNFLTAIRPPIVKAYSVGDIKTLESLMINASKFSFALLLFLSAPFFFESSYILELWLETPPAYTDVFCKWELGLSVLSSIFLPLVFAIHATAKIKFMSVVNGSIWFMVIPLTWLLLKAGYDPTVPYILKIFLLVFVVLSNLYSTKKNIPAFNIRIYLRRAVSPSFMAFLLSMGGTYIVFKHLGESNFLRFAITCTVSSIAVCICTYYILLDNEMRCKVITKLKQKLCI